jgi:crotonobetainyl-CoA:carnitine CoA-transferase CaiB-like acyl-CoA transferase
MTETTPDTGPQPLDGVVVLDLGQIYNAPYATLLMALAGAKVIKVEPRGGENLRGRTQGAGAGAPFIMLNSNKLGVTLNLRNERGRELFHRMTKAADVVVENYRPGVTDRLGIGPDVLRELNPRLIYASSSGFGRSGPYRDLAAMDLTVQAMAGIMSITGFPDRPPVKAGPAVADFFAGIHLYGAIMTALFDRERTGRGRVVEVAMFESVYPSLMSSLGLMYGHGRGEGPPLRTGNRHSGLAEAPYNVYPTADGYIAIICVTDAHWQNLVGLMDRPDIAAEERFATRRLRAIAIDEVDELVTAYTSRMPRDELVEKLREAQVPCAPVRDLDEVVADPHLHERGMLTEVEDPDSGPLTLPHSPLRYEDLERLPLQSSPRLGEHNKQIFGDWLGLSEGELAELAEEETI